MKTDPIKQVATFSEKIYKELGSEFIAQLYPINSSEEAEEILRKIRKQWYDATHHCWGYILGEEKKSSDDGEPKGTAGIRIINAFQHEGVSNTLGVVIRYFGGKKLGVGPLGKAYYQSMLDVLEIAAVRTLHPYATITLTMPLEFLRPIEQIIYAEKAQPEYEFTETHVTATIILPSEKAQKFQKDFLDRTYQKGVVSVGGAVVFRGK